MFLFFIYILTTNFHPTSPSGQPLVKSGNSNRPFNTTCVYLVYGFKGFASINIHIIYKRGKNREKE